MTITQNRTVCNVADSNFDKVFIDVIEFSNNFDDVSAPIIEYLTSKNYSVCNIFCDVFMIHDQSQFKA